MKMDGVPSASIQAISNPGGLRPDQSFRPTARPWLAAGELCRWLGDV